MKSALFSPFTMRGLTIDNRIMLSPLCQYSSVDGCMNDWQMTHLGMFAMSGASFVCFEMTDVEAAGRITYGDTDLLALRGEALRRQRKFLAREIRDRVVGDALAPHLLEQRDAAETALKPMQRRHIQKRKTVGSNAISNPVFHGSCPNLVKRIFHRC